MILRSVALEGCRCFRNRIEVGEFGDGINLLIGANESGKSTIVEAVARALFDRHGTSGRGIGNLQPWGTNLRPKISLELEVDDRRYQLEKRFVGGQESELSEWDGSGYQRFLTDDGADDFVRELMLGTAAGRGATKPEQWGLARTMWCLQRCQPSNDEVDGRVADRLREALGGTVVSAERGIIGEQIIDALGEHFTGGGKVKVNSPVGAIRDDLSAASKAFEDLQGRYSEADDHEAELARLEREFTRLQEELDKKGERQQELEREAERVRELRDGISRLREREEGQKAERDKLGKLLKQYDKAADALKEAKDEQKKLTEALSEARVDLKAAERLHVDAGHAEKQADAAHRAAREALDLCRDLQKAHALLKERDALQTRIDKLQGHQGTLSGLERRRDERVWPSAEHVDEARKLATQEQVEQARLESVGVSVSVELLRAQKVTFEGGQEPRSELGEVGETIEYRSGQEAVITIDGVACVRARSEAEETAAIAAEVEQLTADLHDLLARFDVEDTEALARLEAEGASIAGEIRDLKREIRSLAGEDKDLSGVQQHLIRINNDLTSLARKLELPEEQLSEREPGDEEALTDAEKAASKRHDEAVDTRKKGEEAKDDAIQQERKINDELTDADINAEGAQSTLKTVLQGVSCIDRDGLKRLGEEAGKQLTALQEQIAGQERELPDELSDPAEQLKTTKQAIDSLSGEKEDIVKRQAVLNDKLKKAQAEDLFAQMQAAEEEVDSLKAALGNAVRDAVSTRLLAGIYQTRRESAAKPFGDLEEKFNRILQAVIGKPRSVKIASDFSMEGFSEPGGNGGAELREIDQLSSGAREQIELIHRLSLGEVYAEEFGRQMLVLDDVLVHTDPARHDQMLEILKRSAGTLQIFILTSRPQFYRGVTERACEFDIAALAE